MELDTDNQKFINIVIDFSRDFPLTINPGTENEKKYPSLIEMINPDDIPPITEMFTDISANSEKPFEAHCRFMVQGDYHWFFLSCKPVFGGYGKPIHFEGTMCDVSTYLETAGDDLVYKEFKKKHNIKLSELKKGSVGLEEVLDRDYLASIQKPFAQPQLYSGIFTASGKLICTPEGQQAKLSPDDFGYQKKKSIRINHLVGGYWILAARSQELLDEYYQLWETLVLTVSRMANAFVVVLQEMDNSQNANKLLGQNVEEQILLNNIYAIIMQSRTAQSGLREVISLVGEYFKLDRISIVNLDGLKGEDFCWSREIRHSGELIDHEEFKLSDVPNIIDDLQNNSASFSDSGSNDLVGSGIRSYAVFKLFDSGCFDAVIAYEMLDAEHIWSQRERKQLRNISQIISSILMRKKTQEKLEESQRRMRQLAFYDSIYKVPNRARLNKDLTALLKKGTEGSLIAFKVTNTRNLSAVNGHTYSDLLLRSVAQYLSSLPVEGIGVYYFTNAIFMINLPDNTDREAKKLAEMLIQRFSKPWEFEGEEQNIHCSLGIAYYPVNGKTAEEICKAASVAMYRAREFKKNSYTFYSGTLEKTRSFAASMEQHITESIKNGMAGFSLKFQPVFSAEEGSVKYCESLVRWHDEQYGNIPNSTLFPLVENLGISHIIDSWVLGESCRFCKEVQDSGFADFKISVNLTAGELQSAQTVSLVEHALKESGLAPQSLILEIPVKANLSYSDSAHILTDLKALGVKVSIDSYGTEDISLKVLKNSYVNIINIPRALLSECEEDFDRELINAIINLAHCKKIKICIKGIENEEQLKIAQSHGIDWVQGYYCSRPLMLDEMKSVLVSPVRK